MKCYEKMTYGENLGWCKPYMSDDDRIAVALMEGEIITVQIDGRDIEWDEDRKTTWRYSAELLHRLARSINPDYDDYNGYDDTEIILDALHERGCSDCPWRDECDAMDCEEEDI